MKLRSFKTKVIDAWNLAHLGTRTAFEWVAVEDGFAKFIARADGIATTTVFAAWDGTSVKFF